MGDDRREKEELQQARRAIDDEIAQLLGKRARLSRSWATSHPGERATLPSTAEKSLDEVVEAGPKDLPAPAMRAIFREIHASCRSLEAAVKVAYVGPESAAAHTVARRKFGALAELAGVDTVPQAIALVREERADFAVLPYDTAAFGPVQLTVAALAQTDLSIVAVDAEAVPTGEAGGEGEPARARFCVVGRRPASRTGRDVTAILVTVNDEPGSLFETLKHFAERGLNLRSIQSRTSGATGESSFFLEVSGHGSDRAVVLALEATKQKARSLHVLGSYPV